MEFANRTPVIVERRATIEQLVSLFSLQDQRYLSEGLVIVEHGRYVGLVTLQDLVGAVTEARIAAARYANPPSRLRGNIRIDTHIGRAGCRLQGGRIRHDSGSRIWSRPNEWRACAVVRRLRWASWHLGGGPSALSVLLERNIT